MPARADVLLPWTLLGLALVACSSAPEQPPADAQVIASAGQDAGLDAAVAPAPDAATPEAPDVGWTCGPLEIFTGDAGGPNTTVGSCLRDRDCPKGQFCDSAQRVCALPASLGYSPGNGTGGAKADGSACSPAFAWPATCDLFALDWTASLDVSRAADSFVESDTAVAADGKGVVLAAWAAMQLAPASPPMQANRLAISRDDGATFKPVAAPVSAASDASNDAVVAYDPAGRWLYLWESYASNFQGAQHIQLSTSADAEHWSAATQLDTAGDYEAGGSLDFPWLTLDSANQRLFVTYQANSALHSTTEKLVVGKPDGTGFSASVNLDDGTRANAIRNLAQHAVDTIGGFYAVWLESGGGEKIGGTISGATTTAIWSRRFEWWNGKLTGRNKGDVRVSRATDAVTFDTASIAVRPDGSVLHVIYVAGSDNAVDVYVATSRDRGVTWSSVRVNDDTGCATHFHPSLMLDPSNRLWVFWYDNRDGAGHYVYSMSDDAGATFRASRPVSAPAFPFSTLQYSTGWLGDYCKPAIAAQSLYLLWADGRAGGQSHAFFAKAALH